MLSKRKIAVIITASLVFTLSCVMFTIALLTDQRAAENTFSFGEVKISLAQIQNQSNELVPGDIIRREPVITSEGAECYVRAIITLGDNTANNQAIKNFIEFSPLGNGWYVSPDDTAEWNESDRIIVYYNKPLEKGASTTAIFDTFTLNVTDAAGQALLEGANRSGFNIDIVAEAVQATAAGDYYESPEAAFAGIELSAADSN